MPLLWVAPEHRGDRQDRTMGQDPITITVDAEDLRAIRQALHAVDHLTTGQTVEDLAVLRAFVAHTHASHVRQASQPPAADASLDRAAAMYVTTMREGRR